MFAQWKTRDLIITAVLAVALGVLLWAWSVLYQGGEAVLTNVGANLLYGVYFLPGIMIPYIVRKPGAALLGSTPDRRRGDDGARSGDCRRSSMACCKDWAPRPSLPRAAGRTTAS